MSIDDPDDKALATSGDATTQLVDSLQRSFETALPTHVTKEQFARALQTALRNNPKIAMCDVKSISTSVLTAAQLGLMIGVNGSCWLLPFNDKHAKQPKCELIIGYQGMVDLCYRSNLVDGMFSDIVCENDRFDFVQGLEQRLNHVPNLRAERGDPFAVYAMANIRGSSRPVFVVMNKSEVYKVRNSSAAYRNSGQTPWKGEFETEMWKKTAIRRLAKILPKSVELVQALDFESKQESRWADANVVDDPFTPGRKSLANKRAPQSPAPPPSEDEFLAAMSAISAAYDERQKFINAELMKFKVTRAVMELGDNPTDDERRAVIAVAAKLRKES